jgi:hypothetical protein
VDSDETCSTSSMFEQLVMARIIKPGSKRDAVETLAEVGVASPSASQTNTSSPNHPDETSRILRRPSH